jgi:hypothetical protein
MLLSVSGGGPGKTLMLADGRGAGNDAIAQPA